MIFEECISDQLHRNYNYASDNVPVRISTIALNQVFQVGNDYFVKVSKAGELQSNEQYSAKLALLRLMGEQGLPVPKLVPTSTGENFVSFLFFREKYNLEVHQWIQNTEHYQRYPGQIEQVAESMAQYHSFFDDVRDSRVEIINSLTVPFTGMTKKWNCAFVDELHRYAQRLDEVPPPLRLHLSRALPIMREYYKERLQQAEKPNPGQTLDKGIVHADLHDLQILFDKNTKQLRAFIDWEGTRNDFRSFDLGYTVDRLSMDTNILYHNLSAPLELLKHDPRQVNTFMESYLSKRTIGEADIQSMVDQLVLECLNRNARWLRQIFTPDKIAGAGNRAHTMEDFEKFHLYFRIMSLERIEELRQHLSHGS